jgi:hypothetical protein
VTGQQQRHQLVAQLAVAERLVVFVAGLQQHREDVVVAGHVGLSAAGVNLLVDDAVGRGDELVEATPRAARARVLRAGDLQRQQTQLAGGGIEQAPQRCPDALDPLGVVEPKDGAEDDLQGDRLHRGSGGERGAVRPGGDLALGDRTHRLPVSLHPLAVEGGQHQPALAHVLGAVEQQHRAVAQQRSQDLVVLAGEQLLGIAGEDRLHRLRVGGDDHRALVGEAQGEVLAVAALAIDEEGGRLQDEAAEQERSWNRGAGRQGGRRGGDDRRGRFVDRQFNSAGISSSY